MTDVHRRRDFLTAAAFALGGAAGILPGCGLRKAALPARTFLLKGPAAESRAAEDRESPHPIPTGVLLVRPVRMAAMFDSRTFVIRRSESEYVSDAYHAFLVSPGAMFAELIAARLQTAGRFSVVTTGGSQLVPTHALESEIAECYGDYRDPRAPKAVLAIQFRLLHPLTGGSAPLRWQFGARKQVDMERATADYLVAGWEEAFARFCDSLDFMFGQPGVGS